MIKPPVCSSIIPLIPRMLQIEGVDNRAFVHALETRINQITLARFSNKEDPLHPQKWVVPGYSGYVTRFSDGSIQIIVITPNQPQSEPIIENGKEIIVDKKRKSGLRYLVTGTQVVFQHIVFKRISTTDPVRIKDFILTSRHQAHYHKRDPESVAYPPQFLGAWTKGDLHKQEWWEPQYLGTLLNLKVGGLNKAFGVWHPFPFDQFAKGMRGIAKHLVYLQAIGNCHLDVKIDNIFVSYKDGFCLHLSDYELLTKANSFGKIKDYFLWDKVKANTGFQTFFSDIYGWTITLADSLIPDFFDLATKRQFGPDFAELLMDRLIDLQIIDDNGDDELTDEEALQHMDGKSPNEVLNFYVKVYHFVKKVAQIEERRDLISKMPDFNKNPVEHLKEAQISSQEFLAFASDLYETAQKIRGSSATP